MGESAVPLGLLASDALLHGTRTRDDANALWAKIQAVTVQKRQFCVQRRIGIFLQRLKDVARLKKKFNLRMMASKFRDSLPAETAFLKLQPCSASLHRTSNGS